MRDGIETGFLAVVGGVLIAAVIFLLWGWLSFYFGMLLGIFLKAIIGEQLVEAAALLGVVIKVNDIPLICGLLQVVGSFFRGGEVGTKVLKPFTEKGE